MHANKRSNGGTIGDSPGPWVVKLSQWLLGNESWLMTSIGMLVVDDTDKNKGQVIC